MANRPAKKAKASSQRSPRQRKNPKVTPQEVPAGAPDNADEFPDRAVCPVCGRPEHAECQHLMHIHSVGEETAFWYSGGLGEPLRLAFEQLSDLVEPPLTKRREFSDALARLPADLRALVEESLGNGWEQWVWDEHLERFLCASPTFAGTTEGESTTYACSSSWTCYWDSAPSKVKLGPWVAKQVVALQKLAAAVKRLSTLKSQ